MSRAWTPAGRRPHSMPPAFPDRKHACLACLLFRAQPGRVARLPNRPMAPLRPPSTPACAASTVPSRPSAGTVASRARVLVAGSIISSIAYFLIIAVVGWHDEDAALRPQYDTEGGREEGGRAPPAGTPGCCRSVSAGGSTASHSLSPPFRPATARVSPALTALPSVLQPPGTRRPSMVAAAACWAACWGARSAAGKWRRRGRGPARLAALA
jgi:hypothetical protein